MQEVDDFYAQKRKTTSNQITEQDLVLKTGGDENEETKKVLGKKIKNELFEKNLERFKKQLREEFLNDFDKMNNRISKIDEEVKY